MIVRRATSPPRLLACVSAVIAAALTVACAYLAASPIAYGYLAAPGIAVGCALFAITIVRPLWLFPLVAALSLLIVAVPAAGAKVTVADLITGLILLAWLATGLRQPWDRNAWRIAVPFLVLIGACAVTLPVTSNLIFGVVKIVQRSEFLLLFAATVSMLREREMIRHTIDAYLYSAAALAAVTAAVAVLGGFTTGGVNVAFYNKNSTASFFIMAIPLVVARLVFNPAKRRNRLWLALAGVLTGGLIATGSRGAWIGTVLALGVLMALKSRAAFLRYVLVMGVALAILLIVLPPDLTRISEFAPSNLGGQSATVESGGTVLSRLALWQDGLHLIASHPLFGVGVGSYLTNAPHTINHVTSYFSTTDPHNSFIYMWAELGPLGLLAFVWLLIGIFGTTLAVCRATRGSDAHWMAAGIVTGLLAYILFTLTEPIWPRGDGIIFFLLAGVAINLRRSTRRGRSAMAPLPSPRYLHESPHS